MNHESLSIPEDEVFCELEERQYQKFKARLLRDLGIPAGFNLTAAGLIRQQLLTANASNQGLGPYHGCLGC